VSKEVAEKTYMLQGISTERLKRRSKDIYYWMKELERMIQVRLLLFLASLTCFY